MAIFSFFFLFVRLRVRRGREEVTQAGNIFFCRFFLAIGGSANDQRFIIILRAASAVVAMCFRFIWFFTFYLLEIVCNATAVEE